MSARPSPDPIVHLPPPDSIVHRRSNSGHVHPVVVGGGVEKRVSFHEYVVDPGHGGLIQIRVGEWDERGAPEGQEDPQQPSETSSAKRWVLKPDKPKFPSLYVRTRNSDVGSGRRVASDEIALDIALEMKENGRDNLWDKHLTTDSDRLADIVKRDLSLKNKESVYRVSTHQI